jgi:AcrR family transcriptional regulator
VFQHFDDLDSLYASVADAQWARLSQLISQKTGRGPLAARLRSFLERRVELLETITPVRRAALLQEPFSDELARRLRFAHELARSEIERTFAPELAAAGKDQRSILFALDVATNWSAWDTLRRLNGLSVEESKRVMATALDSLIGTSPSTTEAR